MDNIKYVIYLTPENRSAHYVFGCFDPDHSNHYCYRSDGSKVYCSQVEPKVGGDGIFHDISNTLYSINGVNGEPMTGFLLANENSIKDKLSCLKSNFHANEKDLMGYTKMGSMNVLHTLAANYTLCNNWYSSVPTSTIPNRLYMVSATSQGQGTNSPLNILSSLKYTNTIFDRLDEKSISWKYYYDEIFGSVTNLKFLNPKNLSNVFGSDKLIDDIKNGKLASYSYVQLTTPDAALSDLQTYNGNEEQYIADVYNALQNSEYWNNTLIIIAYDEHGGFYDNSNPPSTVNPDGKDCVIWSSNYKCPNIQKFTFEQLGVRVPALLISPRIPQGVDNNVYDHTSALAFTEKIFDLEPLTLRDKEANCNFIFTENIRDINTLPKNLSSNYALTDVKKSCLFNTASFLGKFITLVGKTLTCSC